MDASRERQVFALLTTQVAAAYLSNHPVALTELAGVISTVHSALRRAASTPAATGETPPVPKVPVKRSVTPDYLVCLEDGIRVKMLKRHLRTRHNLTPEEYRSKWGLPASYSMVAPNYRERRSAFARASGLGRRRPPMPKPALKADEKPRGRRRKK
jgi:predicted transcriptional regulator